MSQCHDEFRRGRAFVVFMLTVAVAGPWAWAQESERDHPTTQPTTQPDADASVDEAQRGPMAGPQLAAHMPPPGVATGFSAATAGGIAARWANVNIYSRILREMDLTSQQESSMRAIGDRYREEVQAYDSKHAREQRQLWSKRRELGYVPPQNQTDQPAPELSAEAVVEIERINTRLRTIRNGRPRPDVHLTEIWYLLTVEQQADFMDRLRVLIEEQQQAARQREAERAGNQSDQAQPMSSDTASEDYLSTEGWTRRELQMLERFRRQRQLLDTYRQRGAPAPPGIDEIVFESDGSGDVEADDPPIG